MPVVPTSLTVGQALESSSTSSHAIYQQTSDANWMTTSELIPRAVGLAMRQDSNGTGLSTADSSIVFATAQKHDVQVIASCMACISISATTVAIYWFCMIRRNYRRDLVLMLILSDFFKSMCYFTHGAVNFTQGQVETTDRFCQASGYMLQTGLEACDFAILFISLHMALQIFPLPNTVFGYDGLYNVRHWVFAIWLIVPNLTAALAFINPANAYQTLGPWCWLPVRPFWYRLALSWIPRYMITILIIGITLRIYLHVGSELRFFGQDPSDQERASLPTSISAALAQNSRASADSNMDIRDRRTSTAPAATIESQSKLFGQFSNLTSGRPSISRSKSSRPPSLPDWSGQNINTSAQGEERFSGFKSRRASRTVSIEEAITGHEAVSPLHADVAHHAPRLSIDSHTPHMPSLDGAVTSPELQRTATPDSVLSGAGNVAGLAMRKRRRAIQRQVRTLFVYPLAYVVLWTVPFISQCMNYVDYWALHPIFAISLVSSMSQTSLGFVDASIFCWRERPWRHIPGSDGTCLGSFRFWEFCKLPNWLRCTSYGRTRDVVASPAVRQTSDSNAGLLHFLRSGSSPRDSSSVAPARPSIPHGRAWYGHNLAAGSDQKTMEKQLAPQRLASERDVWEKQKVNLQEPEQVGMTDLTSSQETSAIPGERNWFDMGTDIDEEDFAFGVERAKRPA